MLSKLLSKNHDMCLKLKHSQVTFMVILLWLYHNSVLLYLLYLAKDGVLKALEQKHLKERQTLLVLLQTEFSEDERLVAENMSGEHRVETMQRLQHSITTLARSEFLLRKYITLCFYLRRGRLMYTMWIGNRIEHMQGYCSFFIYRVGYQLLAGDISRLKWWRDATSHFMLEASQNECVVNN